jgi:hypothetical protein
MPYSPACQVGRAWPGAFRGSELGGGMMIRVPVITSFETNLSEGIIRDGES